MGDRRVINDHNTGHRTPPPPQTQSKPAPAAAVQEAAGAHQTALHGRHTGHHGPSRWHGCRRAPARRPRPASFRSGGLHLRQRAERAAFSPRCGRTPEKWPKGDLRGTKITTRSAARQQAACPPRAARRRSPRPALEGLCRPVAAVAPQRLGRRRQDAPSGAVKSLGRGVGVGEGDVGDGGGVGARGRRVGARGGWWWCVGGGARTEEAGRDGGKEGG